MDIEKRAPDGPCIVVHNSPLVADDLRELLTMAGAADVVVARNLDSVEGQAACLAIVKAEGPDTPDRAAVRDWLAAGTPVIVLNGRANAGDKAAGLYAVDEPFSSADIHAILRQTGVFEG